MTNNVVCQMLCFLCLVSCFGVDIETVEATRPNPYALNARRQKEADSQKWWDNSWSNFGAGLTSMVTAPVKGLWWWVGLREGDEDDNLDENGRKRYGVTYSTAQEAVQ